MKALHIWGCCCLAVAALVGSASAAPPKRNGLIAFVAHGYSGFGIAVIRPGGGGLRMLTRDFRDRAPAWSANGAWLAFGRAGRLYVIRPDGSGLKPLEPAGARHDSEPTWSPDGKSVAFVRGGRSLMVMRINGSGIRHVYTSTKGHPIDGPSWSPDGKWIAFSLHEDACDSAGGSIMAIRPNGTGMRVVTGPCAGTLNGATADDSDPSWSPDGKQIAFTRLVWLCDRCDQDEIFISNADGSNVHWVTTDTTYESSHPAWSPDGQQLAAQIGGVAILDLAGNTLANLDPSGTDPEWQPRP
jgi:TolB protein